MAAAFSQTPIVPSWERRAEMPSSAHLVWGSVIFNNGDPCCEAVSSALLEASADAKVIETMRDRAFRMGPVLWLKAHRRPFSQDNRSPTEELRLPRLQRLPTASFDGVLV